MQTILIILTLACVTNFWTWAMQPLQWLKSKLKIDQMEHLNCSICVGFWIGLGGLIILGQPWYYAPIVAFAALYLDNHFN